MSNFKTEKWPYTPEQLKKAVESSICVTQVKTNIGLSMSCTNILKRCALLDIDTSHLVHNPHMFTPPNKRKSLDEYLVENSSARGSTIAKKLLSVGIFERKCYFCSQTTHMSILTENKAAPIPLELHHINGKNRDNRIENIILICRNCHAFTDTFCQRNNNKKRVVVKLPKEAYLKEKSKKGNLRPYPIKTIWPTDNELQALLWEKPTTSLAKTLQVSDTAIGKYAAKRGLTKPPRGCWTS